MTGVALILFLTFHGLMNVVALVSAHGYNLICKFLGANWYALAGTAVLALLVLLHFVFAIWLTLLNRRARGNNRYAITSKPEKVEWASQNMFVLGLIVVLGLLLHLYNFWLNMMFAELAHTSGPISPTDGISFIIRTFSCPVFTVLYLIWLAALWFHLNHGFWSAIQTLGWNGKVWFTRWRVIGRVYTSLVILLFVAVALAYGFGYRPADYVPPCHCPRAEMATMAPMPKGAPASICAPKAKHGAAAPACAPKGGKRAAAPVCGHKGQQGAPCVCGDKCECGQGEAPTPQARRGDKGVRPRKAGPNHGRHTKKTGKRMHHGE